MNPGIAQTQHLAALPEKDACGVGFIFSPKRSHTVLSHALQAISRLEHRGACGADCQSGDGAGVLTAIPWDLFENEGYHRRQHQAVAVLYLPPKQAHECKAVVESKLHARGFSNFLWRSVPTHPDLLGPLAKMTCPHIEQLLVQPPASASDEIAEQHLASARKYLLNHCRTELGFSDFYIASFSTRTIVYKAMIRGPVLGDFYPDLLNDQFQSTWAVYHRRFSTNTLPRWSLAQPFRMLAHNGEINTLLGNLNWMKAREPLIREKLSPALQNYLPVIDSQGSDSANLDDTLELLVRMGHSVESALIQLIPEAYDYALTEPNNAAVAAFYQYYAALQEPWDGPALIVYSDGVSVGATMDRNGLRPARYTRLADGSIIFGSETGIIETPIAEVTERGRLGPGQILSVDLKTGRLRKNGEIKQEVANQHPYSQWLKSKRRNLTEKPFLSHALMPASELLAMQHALGYGKEDVEATIATMAQSGAEPVFSMGDDTPLAVLSHQPRVLYDYFKQRFAQVTNPPIDHLREKLVMSIDVHLGPRSQLLVPCADGASALHLKSPILNEAELDDLRHATTPFAVQRISLLFENKNETLDQSLNRVCEEAVAALAHGKSILILSDRGVSTDHAAIPALLAVGAVHHHLIRMELRLACSLVVETGQCWGVHHHACLLGFGAQAVCPYLALETVRHRFADHLTIPISSKGTTERTLVTDKAIVQPVQMTIEQAQKNYKLAIEEGLQKVLSKMGISVLSSYIGAQIFECIGLGPKIIERCFAGTVSRIGGLEIEGVAQEVLRFHQSAYPEKVEKLKNYGMMNHRMNGEFHGNNPQLVRALHKATDLKRQAADQSEKQNNFQIYSNLVRERPPAALRDLLTIVSDRKPISLEAVEPLEAILSRFCTGGMSLGALSKETHEVLAIAMNRLGGKSNCGEGGEDPLRYYPIRNITGTGTSPDFPGLKGLRPGDSAASAIRQVASARFGVTTEYLVTAKQLEIKIAQGAKPGEGGQLPGHKVSDYIARLRLAKPGIPLISPPPHHDIYSIEDLAQLIFDLNRVNPGAKVSVKLVSEIGIGTVAAGVAKANADIVQISGHDGGTGASPLGSIKNAGVPWELGLAESHQTLLANRLRDRVLLRIDGGLRSGWDIVTAALLGADEFGFASIALIAAGCIMARICHTNNCPIGITSQKEELRSRFSGDPKAVTEFFVFLAEEVRYILAQLGYHSIGEILGRVDLLRQRPDLKLAKLAELDLSCLLSRYPEDANHALSLSKPAAISNDELDDRILADPDVERAISEHGHIHKSYSIANTDRSVGARLSGRIATEHGNTGFAGQITLDFVGSAGQSFGAFNVQNVRLVLSGDANDCVGKGLTGGEIIIKPFAGTRYRAAENIIMGNTCLYGATGGALFAAGQAGERFAVRNSRAAAVIEGAGDHCCEYMTGGIVVVLGTVGRNFGAGMTGGIAYVLDESDLFEQSFNADSGKQLRRVPGGKDSALRALIEVHYHATDSQRAQDILANWSFYLQRFWQVVPPGEDENPVWPIVELTATAASQTTHTLSGHRQRHLAQAVELQDNPKLDLSPVNLLDQKPSDQPRFGT